ncbi:uncharacterized protein LOC143283803 [Babylonia areolata]|uniref:uncharacterized protein LOC143283803 n=1 Tax=Babylonia areolata TaxID=304850 RepID=UPI003FD0DE7A
MLNDYVATFSHNDSVTLQQACEDSVQGGAPYKGSRHHVFVKQGSEESSFSACPQGLLGDWNNDDDACKSTYSTCADSTQLKVTGTACSPKPFFSDGGSVGCLHSVKVSDTTYVTLYNSDASPDGTTTFAFTCVALSVSDGTLTLSQNPLQCDDSQSPSSITTKAGALFVYKQTGDCSTEDDLLLVIIIVVVLLLILLIIIIIIIICLCRKKRQKKQGPSDEDAILTKEDEERGSNLSLDSGFPRCSTRGDSTGRGMASHGTPLSHFTEVYEVAEEKEAKEVNVGGHRRRRQRLEPGGKEGEEAYETDGEADYSDDSWEEYVDDEGNTQVRPKKRRRRRRRKKQKQTYTRTHVLADGTTVEEEVESEYSVTASSDVTSSDEDRESLTDQIRAEKEKRRGRLQKIMDGPVGHTTVIITREMDEKNKQAEKEQRPLFNKLLGRARDRKDGDRKSMELKGADRKGRNRKGADRKGLNWRGRKGKVQNRDLFPKQAGGAEVAGVTGVGREVPFLLQYQKKKDLEKKLNDEGFFDDPNVKITAETAFGFAEADRQLSPKPGDSVKDGEEGEEERGVSPADSSQSDLQPGPRDGDDDVSEEEEGGDGKVRTEGKERHQHVTNEDAVSSPAPSSDSGMVKTKDKTRQVTIKDTSYSSDPGSDSDSKEDDSSWRKSSDTSSGVADLSPSHQPSSPDQSHAHSGPGGMRDDRRISVGWEKVHGLYSKQRLSIHGAGGKTKGGSDGRGAGKSKKDKRVKTALRRLLNERLFGISDKKKSRREDDTAADNWTNPDSIANNVSDTSSVVGGVRLGTRQTGRPLTQGKVAFAEVHDKNGQKENNADSNHHEQTNEGSASAANAQARGPTRGGSRLPPLRTPTMPPNRVFTPAKYPKWGLCVTASQRAMMVSGIKRDRTFLSKAAWSAKTDDSMILPPHSRSTGKTEETADDESFLDPHRPDTEENGKENEGGGEPWAHRRGPPPGSYGSNSTSVSFTKSSGRSPLDFDDRRLRRLLEELYKDKKFMDKLINNIDKDHLEFPDHMAADDVKFLSEFGRHYLMERAEYWDMHGPLGPPRPPPTALGLRLSRAQTSVSTDAFHHSSDGRPGSPRPKTVR